MPQYCKKTRPPLKLFTLIADRRYEKEHTRMTANAYTHKNMLHTYGRQLTSAKRLARFRRALKLSQAQDVVTISREAKRRELIERVAKEIIENLIVDVSDNPVITEIQDRMELAFGERFMFEYPLDGQDLQILRDTGAGPEELSAEEKRTVMNKLWEITMSKVDETML